jgi:endonuclease/exonuclease/phosphatase family metal-dependent hydrolase
VITKMDFPEAGKLLEALALARASVADGATAFGQAPPTVVNHNVVSAYGGVVSSWNVPEALPVFGNTAAANACLTAHFESTNLLSSVLTAFANTLDSDVERLKVAIMMFHEADGASADLMLQSAKGLDVFSAHLAVRDKNTAVQDEQIQAGQLDQLRTASGTDAGSAIVAGDFNSEPGSPDSPFGQALDRFGEHGYDPHGGDLHDGQGGTSESHYAIDYLMPRGVATTPATRWDREKSDHDGQVVEVTIPDW